MSIKTAYGCTVAWPMMKRVFASAAVTCLFVTQVFGAGERGRLELILPTQAASSYVTDQIISFQVSPARTSLYVRDAAVLVTVCILMRV